MNFWRKGKKMNLKEDRIWKEIQKVRYISLFLIENSLFELENSLFFSFKKKPSFAWKQYLTFSLFLRKSILYLWEYNLRIYFSQIWKFFVFRFVDFIWKKVFPKKSEKVRSMYQTKETFFLKGKKSEFWAQKSEFWDQKSEFWEKKVSFGFPFKSMSLSNLNFSLWAKKHIF